MTVVCDDLMKIQGSSPMATCAACSIWVSMSARRHCRCHDAGGIRVRPGTLAVDVLNLMQSRHITSLWLPMATSCWVWYICMICCAQA
jgi:arabinose-5-phosphate isomerase